MVTLAALETRMNEMQASMDRNFAEMKEMMRAILSDMGEMKAAIGEIGSGVSRMEQNPATIVQEPATNDQERQDHHHNQQPVTHVQEPEKKPEVEAKRIAELEENELEKSVKKADCDYSRGKCVRDENHRVTFSYTENCPFLDLGFRCGQNGRKDDEYQRWRWQPDGCDLPRFNASNILERIRNGLIVFAGDSIGRNQWESLMCVLAKVVSNKSSIYEANENPITKHRGYLSMKFHEYNLSIEYYRAPFLVILGRPPSNSSEQVRSVIKVDLLDWYSKQWVGADVLVFNTGHWWNNDKTIIMACFQERERVNITMGIEEGFRKALETWKTWAVEDLVSETSHVFFLGYSSVHYRDGTWNEGGHCHTNTEPETNYTKKKSNRLASEEYGKIVLVLNMNRNDSNIEARTVEDAIVKMSVVDSLPVNRHPEKRSGHKNTQPKPPPRHSYKKLNDAIQNSSSSVLLWLNAYFHEIDLPLEKLTSTADTLDIKIHPQKFLKEFELCLCIHQRSKIQVGRALDSNPMIQTVNGQEEGYGFYLLDIHGSDSRVTPIIRSLVYLSYVARKLPRERLKF